MPTAEAPSTEFIQILVNLIRGDRESAVYQLRSSHASADEFLRFAAANGLSVVVLRALENATLRAMFLPSAIELLEKRAQERADRSLRLLRELDRIAEIFAAAGQRFMLLKGPYLAKRFYGDSQGREYSDLDLLVPAQERARVFRLFANAGYARRSRVLLGTRLTCYFVHAFDFTRDKSVIDLHWSICRHPSFRIDEARMWAQRQEYELDGRRYNVLSDEYEVNFAILSMLRDIERSSFKIKKLIDLLRIVDALDPHLDWDAFFEERRRDGALGASVNVLGLCLELAGGETFYPRLRATLARHVHRRIPSRPALSPFVFAPASFGIGNKLWCVEVYESSRAGSLLWWGASLPFRLAVHRHIRRLNRHAGPA